MIKLINKIFSFFAGAYQNCFRQRADAEVLARFDDVEIIDIVYLLTKCKEKLGTPSVMDTYSCLLDEQINLVNDECDKRHIGISYQTDGSYTIKRLARVSQE